MRLKTYQLNTYSQILIMAIVTLLFLSTHIVTAQNKLDQLEQKLQQLPDDTTKINALLYLGEHYCSFDNDKALMYLQEAYTLSLQQNYTEGIGKSLLWQGRVYYYMSNFQIAGKYLDKAKKPIEATGDINTLSFWYLAKAKNLQISGDYTNAIKMFKQAAELYRQTGNKNSMAACFMGIGNTVLDRGEIDKATNYFQEALSLAKEEKNNVVIANALMSIAYAYKAKGSLDSSLIYARQALKIRSSLKMDRHIASSEMFIGKVLIEMGKYAEAEQSLQHALSIFKKLDEKTGIIITNLSMVNVLSKQEKPGAFTLANQTLKEAININNPNLLSVVYDKLSNIYAFTGNYKKAFEFQKNYEHIKDSLFTSEKERMMVEVEAKFQSERKDRDIALLKERARVERNRNIALIIFLIVFLIIIFLLYIMFRYKSTAFNRQQKLLEQEKIIHAQENKIAEKEKQLLQEQLESKNRELASKALEMLRYNETISSIIEKLESLHNNLDNHPEAEKPIKDIITELENHTKQNIWNEFEKIFRNIHTGFYNKLLEICPELTATEIKTAALLKLNLTTKEIAAITFKSEGGIKTTRYRLRKKLGLTNDDKLVTFLMQI